MLQNQNGARTRDHLANERTFLAWIRTALGLIGLGFVVSRMGLFLHELASASEDLHAHRGSEFAMAGAAILIFGVILTLWSGYAYERTRRAIDAQTYQPSSRTVFTISFIVSAGGLGLTILVLWRLLLST